MAKIAASGALSKVSGTDITALTVVTPIYGCARLYAAMIHDVLTVSAVTGGGCSKWSRVTNLQANSNVVELWLGQVDQVATNPTTITTTWSGTPSGDSIDFASQMFKSAALIPRWYATAAGTNASTGTTLTWPNLTPTTGADAYWGAVFVAQTGANGSTSGYTYGLTSNNNVILYNPAITAASAPTATQSPTGYFDAAGCLFSVTDLARPGLNQAVNRAASY